VEGLWGGVGLWAGAKQEAAQGVLGDGAVGTLSSFQRSLCRPARPRVHVRERGGSFRHA